MLIGEDVSKRLDVEPAKFPVIVTRRPKYAFKNEDSVIQAPGPDRRLQYVDGQPLYRQEAIYARDQVELDSQLVAQWMGKLGFKLEIVADYIFSEVKKAGRICADETTLPTLAPAPDRRRRPAYGAMPEMMEPLLAAPPDRGVSLRRQPLRRTCGPASQWLSRHPCRLVDTPPIPSWRDPIAE
ncbi:hypothetical protein AB7M16_004985 [Bradyrhizobium sp. USDA 372]|uniref:Transposase n=1 Tax=Bradyrhizobium yuanmingense TaxID=108015 RepID=A0A1C3XM90_9BRAD|nr:transposase [Bradyrhizobium yuanmingense]SCB53378.1 Transposase [Bradyrhizobium yuanmingense]